MNRFFREKKVFLIGGPGGVGKTTLAAALGIELASQGYKTVVLTVDPARRLAQALGFEKFVNDLQQVPLPGAKGTLHASMLDAQRYLDRVVEKFATRPGQREKILSNPLYKIMVDSLGGTVEYAAMERLLEFVQDPRYEKIVVDTPPSQNALELLSAPQRMADFMDNGVLRWFQGQSPRYLMIFKQGTKIAMKLLQRIFGSEFLNKLGQLLDDIEGMQGGFRERHLEVLSLLKSRETAFFLVTTPSDGRFEEALGFAATLRDQGVPLAGLILNQLEPPVPDKVPATVEIDTVTRKEIDSLLHYHHALYQAEQKWTERFASALAQIPRWLVPRQPQPPQDVAGLSRLSAFLVS